MRPIEKNLNKYTLCILSWGIFLRFVLNICFRNDTQLVRELMQYSLTSDPDDDQYRFNEQAVKSLVRRLRRSHERNTVDNLERSIKNSDPGTAPLILLT